MKLIVFGATGTIGRLIVAKALEQGHSVTAYARRPEALAQRHPALSLVAGDARDAAAVDAAVRGHDAVLVTLGAGRKGGVRAAGTRNIVAAMERQGVRRLICQSTLGAGDSRGNLNFLWRTLMFGLLLRKALADHEAQEAHVRASRLDWTIVRPSAFTDAPADGRYRHGFAPDVQGLSLKIPRADVAGFMLRQLADRTYLHRAAALSC
ncbi:MAG: NAD(P)H-binding protein [Alphaproteobacteria bacterium]